MSKKEVQEPKYLDTNNIAKRYDVSTMFFKGRMGKEFQRGVHYIQRDKRGAIRWCVSAIEAWWGETQETNDGCLMPKAG